MPKLVILWTDVLLYLLLAAIAVFAVYARRHEHLRAPWRSVLRSRMGMAALIVLCVYVIIGVLDSLHFRPLLSTSANGTPRYTAEVMSVLDVLLAPLPAHDEKTYSAPFATHLYAKESVDLPNGRQARVYSRLRYGGAHLQDTSLRADDIRQRVGKGLLQSVGLWLALLAALTIGLAWRRKWPVSKAWHYLRRDKTSVPWMTILVTLGVVIALISITAELAGKYHIFGTDKVGQDVFYQALKSVRTGLLIGTLTTLIMLPFAMLLGIAAGYFRGFIDDAIQYLYTTLSSVPNVLLIAAAVLMLQVYMANHPELFETVAERADLRLLFLCVILGVTSWTGLCRLLRGETLKLRELDYIQAATAFGVNHATIIGRHIVPNVMHIVLISVVLDFSGLVLAEAVLSYVGVGVDPSMHSWGNMINSARLEMAREPIVWWPLLAAFTSMFILVLAANLFSDAVRDAFDPRLRT